MTLFISVLLQASIEKKMVHWKTKKKKKKKKKRLENLDKIFFLSNQSNLLIYSVFLH